MSVDETVRLACNIAKNCGWSAFPCRDDKKPATPHGYKDASSDPDRIAQLWRDHPGPLIGVATGAVSNVAVLDIDPGHPEAFLWWEENHPRLPRTRTYRTRHGGLHLWFRYLQGVTNSQGKLAKGIDTRGEGGYAIFWFATGLECIDHTALQPWPAWLLDALKPHEAPLTPSQFATLSRTVNPDRAIEGIVRHLAGAPEGQRNGMLFWATRKLAEHGRRQPEIEAMLAPVCAGIGLIHREVRATIRSAMRWSR